MLDVTAHKNSELTRANTSTPMTSKIPPRNNPPSHKKTTGRIVLKNRQIIPTLEKFRTVPVAVKKRQPKSNIEIEVKNSSSPAPMAQEKQVETVPVTTYAPNVTNQATPSAITLKEDIPSSAAQKTEIVRCTTPNDNDREKKSLETASDKKTGNVESSNDEKLAVLFDPVTVMALEKMFPAEGKWKEWAGRAARNGLKSARRGRAFFNPYFASIFFLNQRIQGWDRAYCNRVLANNLPARSRDDARMLTGDID